MEKGKKERITIKKILGFLGLLSVVVLCVGLLYFLYQKSQPKKVEYQIVAVQKGNLEKTTVATGKVSPRDEILIKPQISGIITRVLKEAGDHINIGDIIATIQVVPESSSLNSAESQLKVARISLDQITSEHERQNELFKKGVIAKEEMEKSKAQYDKALEDLDNAKESLEIIKTGVSKNTAKYSNTQVKSTINGTLLDVPIKVGNSVIQTNNFNEGTTIASVANMNDLIFEGKVDETEVGRIRAGMPISLSIGAIENKKFEAILEYISPKGVEENGAILFEIKAAAHITDSIDIRAGYSANAQIILDKSVDVLNVPEGCVSFSNDSAFVYIVKEESPEQVFEKRYVTIGLSDGINIEIKSGLDKDQKIRGGVIN